MSQTDVTTRWQGVKLSLITLTRQVKDWLSPARRILLLLLVIIVHYFITGITTIREDEQGVVTRFGAVKRIAPAGILFTQPWPIERVTKLKTTEVRTMPVGYKLVDAIRNIAPRPREVEWITGDKNIINLTLTIKYSISDAVKYLYRVGPRDTDFLIRRSAEACITSLIATMPVDDVLTSGKTYIQEETRRQTQSALNFLDAGIRLVSVDLGAVEPPSNVIDAFNDVATAKSDKAKVINQADGYQRDLIPRARARADRLISDALRYRTETITSAQMDSTSFCQLLQEADKARDITETRIYLETVSRALKRAKTLVIDENQSGKIHLR